MHTNNIDFASVITSRICHDLISPIGAISNGLELLQLTGNNGTGEELVLVSNSVENAKARILYYRMAFGTASEDAWVSTSELNSIIQNYFEELRSNVHLASNDGQSRKMAKLTLLLLLCMNSALPRGGELNVKIKSNGLSIIADTQRLDMAQDLWDHLRAVDSLVGIGAADIQFELTRNEIAAENYKLDVTAQENRLAVCVAV